MKSNATKSTESTKPTKRTKAAELLLACLVLAMAALGAGCDDTDPAWELDNDRIIAVRSSAPQLAPGDEATLELLVTQTGRGPFVTAPQLAIVVPPGVTDPSDLEGGAQANVPAPLASALTFEGGQWKVTAPSAAELDQVRAELAIPAGMPVPLIIGLRIDLGSGPLNALKTVQLSDATTANPVLGAVMINGEPARDGLVLPQDVDVLMSVEGTTEDDEVFWLTSIGSLSDLDDPVATLLHEKDEEDYLLDGHIAVVVRDDKGGVTWGFWSAAIATISTFGSPSGSPAGSAR